MAPGLLAFLEVSFFLCLILHAVGLFCFNNKLGALKWKFGFSLGNTTEFPKTSTAL